MTDYLDEIQRRADAATDGPWRWRNSNLDPVLLGARTLVVMAFRRMGFNGAQPVFRDHERNLLVDAGRENINAFPDAVFIAHARTDVPRLVAALRAVEALHKPLRIYDECDHDHGEHWPDLIDTGHFLTCEAAYMYSICTTCCTEDPDHPEESSYCSSNHDHFPRDEGACPTVTAIRDALEAR